MTEPQASPANPDILEDVIKVIPIVLPLVGGALIFLLAFIAVYLA